MIALPKVIATSVIRSVQQGESHGGIYLVDMQSGAFNQVVDWNDSSITWEGRGMDRGLRGIAFHKGHILIAASDEIFVYDQSFRIKNSYRNRYLKNCHEIAVINGLLYLTSTGFDSILVFNLDSEVFECGYNIRSVKENRQPRLQVYDPNLPDGPEPGDTMHINYVSSHAGRLCICGTIFPYMLEISDRQLSLGPPVPRGSHNSQYYNGDILTNDTRSDRILLYDPSGKIKKSLPVPRYNEHSLLYANIPEDHARQAFARGLCIAGEDILIGGSSPSTFTAYNMATSDRLISVNLSMDVRNCIHGLEIWPY